MLPAQLLVVEAAPPPSPMKPPAVAIEPLAPARYKSSFIPGAELYGKLIRLRGLMRASVPDGDLAAIIEDAVTETRAARNEALGKTSAAVVAAMDASMYRNAVWKGVER